MPIPRRNLMTSMIAAMGLLLSGLTAQAADCRVDTVHLRGDWGKARFTVEVADNASERARGLMGRTSMPRSSGMLFVYHKTGNLAFWMRNTLIPLDIIYMDETGTVVDIAHNAVPLDETALPSKAPARYVLEINGGLARALGIAAGTELRHPAVLQHSAVWPCRAPV